MVDEPNITPPSVSGDPGTQEPAETPVEETAETAEETPAEEPEVPEG
jgi:hypothetical protein